ncbi:hypothetical protein IFR05_013214 [Cadophora sp. M221]|nr:hypothetical protein IFR05_013214 [Cadophora sp. M221]
MTPAFGLQAAYVNTDESNNAIAILFLSWSFLFLLFVVVGIKTNLVLVGIFVSVTVTAVCVSASHFLAAMHQNTISIKLEKIAGICLILGSLAGWYNVAHLLFKDQGFSFVLPLGDLGPTRVVQIEAANQTDILNTPMTKEE